MLAIDINVKGCGVSGRIFIVICFLASEQKKRRLKREAGENIKVGEGEGASENRVGRWSDTSAALPRPV